MRALVARLVVCMRSSEGASLWCGIIPYPAKCHTQTGIPLVYTPYYVYLKMEAYQNVTPASGAKGYSGRLI